jgi:hypothetical protein
MGTETEPTTSGVATAIVRFQIDRSATPVGHGRVRRDDQNARGTRKANARSCVART